MLELSFDTTSSPGYPLQPFRSPGTSAASHSIISSMQGRLGCNSGTIYARGGGTKLSVNVLVAAPTSDSPLSQFRESRHPVD